MNESPNEMPDDDQVALTGLSGIYPSSEDAQQFMERLMNKEDCCTFDYSINHPDVPQNSGKIENPELFDHTFFGVEKIKAGFIDPQHRLILARAYEAILDAGLHPDDIKGTNTGVFVGACASETGMYNLRQTVPNTHAIMGNLRSTIANHLSYILGVNGPSYNSDTACSSGMYAFEEGYRAIKEGRCDLAIICSANLCLSQLVTLQFNYLGVLNNGTGCRPFDDKATGYTRSGAIVAMVLQKLKDANRVYAKILHTKTNSDGYKEIGITFPSSECQKALLEDVFSEAQVDPGSIAFLEAHGTGTRVGDPEELTAIDKFFNPTIEKPLLIGSIKGNIGHSEPSSGLCSITKTIYMLNFDTFVPNIHYDTPRKEVAGLVEGRMKVVTEPGKLPDDARLVAVNCFGFGGANGNVILEKFEKVRESVQSDLPRLVCFSARTQKAIRHFQKKLQDMSDDTSCIRLLHEVFRKPFPQHPFRCFTIFKGRHIRTVDKYYDLIGKRLGLMIGSCDQYDYGIVSEFLKIPRFSATLAEIKKIANNNGILLNSKESQSQSRIPLQTLSKLILQLGLVDLLREDLNLNFDFVHGSETFAKLIAAYARKEISMTQVVLSLNVLSQSQNDTQKRLEIVLGIQQSRNIFLEPGNITIGKDCLIINMDVGHSDLKGLTLIHPKANLDYLLDGLGQLYLEGFNPELSKLYGDISLPVGRNTALISPLIRWKESKHSVKYIIDKPRHKTDKLEMQIGKMKFYQGHVIDERILLPATGYLFHLWLMFAENQLKYVYNTCVVLENVKFHKATPVDPNVVILLHIMVHSNGLFEITESDSVVVTGHIRNADQSERYSEFNEDVDVDQQEFILTTKDVYKELRLRGYNYRGLFRGIHNVGPEAALVKWEENWVTFLDNMLQMAILQKDSRNLYVPVGIERLYIDCISHTQQMKDSVDSFVTVLCDAETKTIRSKFVEVRGVHARSIQKRRQRLQPILETNRFIPNDFTCTLRESIRINVQLLLECHPTLKFRVCELLPKDFKAPAKDEENQEDLSNSGSCLSPFICEAVADLPLITPELTVVTTVENVEIENVTVQPNLTKENILFVAHSTEVLNEAFNSTSSSGFILCKSSAFEVDDSRFVLLTRHRINVNDDYVYFMRKKTPVESDRAIINISNLDEVKVWLQEVQKAMTTNKEVVLISEQTQLSGILGFVNCLRREPGGTKARCVFLMDKDVKFDPEKPFFANQLEKGLPINVLKDQKWGTYKHLLLLNLSEAPCEHVYAHSEKLGDLSSLRWNQGPRTKDSPNTSRVAYSALNFRDLMLAYGKITADSFTKSRLKQDIIQGFECSAFNHKGEAVFGVAKGAISNLIAQHVLEMPVPKNWTLEDAATITAVYSTCICALIDKGNIRKGQSILIHSGCGGVGLAALNICTYYDCNIFVTVGTDEKREYLLKHFPNVKPSHIGNSRDKSFKQMVLKETNGKGVELVLNSLAEEKLKSSVECLSNDGIFLEIGKYDLEMNNELPMDFLNRGCAYVGIMLDSFVDGGQAENNSFKAMISKSITEGCEKGYIKPLPRTVFAMDELEKAFRYMSTGKHIGKILLKIDQEAEKLPGLPRYYCDPSKSYIVFGGLGGFGLELCDWLVLKGAKNLVISSRTGLQSGYQRYRLAIWESYGVNVSVNTEDALTEEGCRKILLEAISLGPVDGIFNLAVVLKDCILENQTPDTMLVSYGPKALLTQHLDKLSRQMCPKLARFVVFSSVSCGRGNGGQTNYGYSNSVMERICEIRHQEGLPALAIQWGAVGDVGLLEDLQRENNEIAIGGTLQQKIANCLEVFDKLIQQPDPIVSSIIVAEKFGHGGSDNPVEAVAKILGLKNIKSISMHAPLTELGMDSMMGVEIKQTLERDFDIILNANDIRTLTFAKLEDIASGELKPGGSEIDRQFAFNMIAPSLHLVRSNEQVLTINESASNYILGFPGIEGTSESLTSLAKFSNVQIKFPHYNLIGDKVEDNIENIANVLYDTFQNEVSQQGTFKIVSHSYGCLSALKLASDFERNLGVKGCIVFIDSAPLLMTKLLDLLAPNNVADFESHLLEFVVGKWLPTEDPKKMKGFRTEILDMSTFDERIKFLEGKYKLTEEEKDGLKLLAIAMHRRVYSVLNYKLTSLEPRLKSKVFLYKPKMEAVAISDDYDLSKWCERVTVKKFDGNHQSILENEEMFKNFKNDLGL